MASTQNVTTIGHCDPVRKANDPRNKRTPNLRVIEKAIRGNKANNTQKKIPKTKAYQAMKKCIDFVELFGTLMSWKCVNDWKSNPRHRFCMIFIMFTWSQLFYSQFKHYMSGEYKKIFEVLAVYGIAISCSLKVRLFVRDMKRLTALHNFGFKLCQQSYGKTADKLEDAQHKNLKLLKLNGYLGIASGFVFIFYPTKSFLYDGELVSLLPIQIMFTNDSLLSGFLIANAFMIMMGLVAISVTTYITLQFVATSTTYSMQVDLIAIDIGRLDEFWRDTTQNSVRERHLFLRNICEKCQDKDNYINEVKKIFDGITFVYFCVTYIAQIICLYIIKSENWIPGYGIAYGLFLEMFFICYVGTRTSITNERLCYAITQSNWYTYDIHSQKIILLLLHSCMNAQELWIGPLAPLSVFTGTEIVKSVYSYYTILMEVM